MIRTVVTIAAVAAVLASTGIAAAEPRPDTPAVVADGFEHYEVPADPYLPPAPNPRGPHRASQWVRDGYVSIQVNVDEFGNNIPNDAANEPSIAVNAIDPDNIVIAWRQFDNIASNFRQAGYAYTLDAGQTWIFDWPLEAAVFRSDPVLDSDGDGNIYYNSLSHPDEFVCTVFKTSDGGQTWDDGTFAAGGDKQWMAIDRSDSIGRGHIYAFWTQWFSNCQPGHFTRSTDGGQSYEACVEVPGQPARGTIAVGPDGEVYVAGEGVIVARSTTLRDAGTTAAFQGVNYVDLDGDIPPYGGPNPAGLLSQVWVAVNHSDGPNRGHVYVVSAVDRDSTTDPADIMFARSTNGGVSWSSPVRVNDDSAWNGAYQWFPTLSVAPNGRIDITWNDTRNDPGGYDSEVYYSTSHDGGLTFSPNVAVSPAFDPHLGWPQQNKIGDYTHAVSDNDGTSLAYSATFNGEEDVYYLRIPAPCSDAGDLRIDRPKYACDGNVAIVLYDCGLNTNDGVTETAAVTISCESEPGGESVVLTETGPDTARFTGQIALSTSDSAGVLHVAEFDTITVLYTDADDGLGHHNVAVTVDAPVDCTPPLVSAVNVTDIEPDSVVVHVDADEPIKPLVSYGPACDALNDTATIKQFYAASDVPLTGLEPGATYRFMVDSADEAGNVFADPTCYEFTTTAVPDYFTELFDGNDNDLDYTQLTFQPDASESFYAGCAAQIAELPTDPAGGTILPAVDDFYSIADLVDGKTVSLYGHAYSRFYIGGNGYLTFFSGQTDADETLAKHLGQLRVSGLYDDLDASAGGYITWKQLDNRAVITYVNVPEKGAGGDNTFQIEMFFDGKITLSYLNIDAQDGLAGLSRGGYPFDDFFMSDLSELGSCDATGDTNCDGLVNNGDIDAFVLALNDPAEYAVQYPGCDINNADTNGDGLVNNGDIDAFVALVSSK